MLVPLQSEKRPKGTPVYRDPENPFNTGAGTESALSGYRND